jgi:hypothetical protein
MIALRHAFQSNVPDRNVSGLIKPTQWNDNHVLTLAPNKVVGRTSASTGPAEEIGGEDGIEITGGAIRISAVPNVAGSYTNPDITVNERGQITAIQNGASLTYYVTLAQQFAENPEDVDVVDYPGHYSSRHWAAKSEAHAGTAETAATNAAASAVTAGNAATAAAASFDAFDDIYLGAKAADPTVDNDGDPLVEGQLYWNTGSDELRVYDGAAWNAYGASSGITAVVDDTSPQLGGDLDLNSQSITGTGNIDITGNIGATGDLGIDGTITGATIMQGANQVLDAGDIGSSVQGYSANLAEWSGLNPSANGGSLVTAADYAAMRALLDLEAGTDFLSPSTLASTSNGQGASLIGIEDAGGLLTATTVEAALAEIAADVAALDAAVVLKGVWDASSGSFPGSGSAQAGWSYIVSVGGTVDGQVFTANDRILAIVDNASTSTYAANWHKLDYTDQVLSVAGMTGAVTLAQANISGLTTSDNPQFAGVNLSHASANTLTGSGGDAFIEGNRLFRAGGADVPLADGGTGASLSDPGRWAMLGWNDTANAVQFLALSDIPTEAAPATGDYVLAITAEGGLVKIDYDDVGGGGGLDIAGLTGETTLDHAADYLPFYDATVTDNRKILPTDIHKEVVIASGSLSGGNVDIPNIPAIYKKLRLIISGASMTASTISVSVQVSTNNGSSFDTTSSNYPGMSVALSGTSIVSANSASLMPSINQTAAQACHADLVIDNYIAAAGYVSATGFFIEGNGTRHHTQRYYTNAGGNNIDAIRIASGGTFDAGTYTLRGIP